jgi:two-component system cell cycle sensor histidine kinase/response regulator CckA
MSQKLDLDFYQALIEHTLEGIVVIGMDGKVRYASESAQNILGYPLGENIGRSVYELVHPDDIKQLQRYFLRLVKEPGLSIGEEMRLKHRDGSWRTIEGIGKSHTFTGEKSPTIVINYRDVTERRKIEREMTRLASVVENSTDAIFLITHTGVILSWNRGGRLVYGYTAEEIGGRSVHMLLAPGRVQEFERILATTKKGEAVNNFETIHRRKDGSEVLVSMTVSPLAEKTGEITRASVIARPVLEREQADAIRKALQLERDELIQRLQLQMERMPMACLLHDHQSRITYINPAAEKTFGYTFAEVNGKSPLGVIVPEFKWASVKGVFEKLIQGDMSSGGILGEGLHKDGRILLCEWYNTPLFDAEGRFTGHITMVLDVTERKKAEEMMARFASVAEYSDDAILGIDMDGNITSWNKGAEKVYGYKAAEVLGKSSSICQPEDQKQDYNLFRELILKGKFISNYETIRVRKGGRKFAVSLTVSPIRNAEGKVIGASAITRDISEKKRAEEVTARFAAVVEHSEDAIIGVDLDGNITSWNKGAEKIYGYQTSEAVGKNIVFYMPQEYAQDVPRFLSMARKGEAFSNYETVRVRKDGQKINVAVTVSPVRDPTGAITGVSVIARDVSEQKKGEEARARLAAIVESTTDAITGSDLEGRITTWSPGAEAMYGWKASEAIGQDISIIAPEGLKKEVVGIRVIIGRGESLSNIETVRRRKNGENVQVSLSFAPVRDSKGRVIGVSAIARDISEKKKAEEMMARFAAVAMYSNDAIVGMDLDGNITSWNKGAERIFGYPADLVVGINLTPYLPRGQRKADLHFLKRVQKGEVVSEYETFHVRQDGQKTDLVVTGSPVRDPQGNLAGISFIVRDISERKKAEAELRRREEQLRLTQKMDTIGRLAGGVAHDFNNLLSVIRGNTEYLLRSFSPEDNRREEMSEILKAVQRGADMTKQLLVFGKKQIAKPQPLNLNDLSLEMERMLKRLVEANIDLAIIPGEDLDQIEADHGQIQEVILNLVLNACDAMPKGGHIIIETKNDTFSESQRDSRVVIPPGHYVRLNVTDTGKGMDRETQKHLFEPFFSTKKGKGSGLGLATVFSIVKKWKGHLALHSSPGLGSTFSIFFPAVGKKLEPQAKPKPTDPMPKGTETILLAEDEKSLRKIIAYTLKSHGYRVLEADNGEEALKRAGKYRKTIHLLLTDVIMPRMDGKELSDKLRKTRPGLRVIFISGYPREILSKRGILRKGVQLLKKPFSMEELIRQIQKILESKKKR